ncbi:DNA-binding transcriptional regulator, LysR family [Acetitomaculum ruminis DSM 5522]|uniref:DNA-binding transcriptional regulator, LysR family n=1 Tax=Acetitomaculum ruminis DSM 5522 TaxID=1120918 RepID=A0A1I0VVJ5_9FIRM|nr:LysR family transcriptional regulator [Acetitomaculum ruminis]SFA80401.1 DNA-binding transcriptional regulator, LysR family [Acetitomaculum ruminis DSM 5522]
MDINYEYYKVFYYVGKTKSITLASEILAITQPAVSQSIKNLEKQLGIKLFSRRSKGMHLTPDGEILFSYVEQGVEHIKKGESKLREILNGEYGEIQIGASDMTLQFYLLPYLEKFYELHPKIKINVTNAPTPLTIKNLREGSIDFGIVSSPFANVSGLDITTVREIQDVFVAGKRFEFLKDKILSYDELKKYPLICLEGNTSSRSYIDSFLRERDVILNPEFELATSYIIVQFALRNVGICSIVEDFAKQLLDSGDIFKLKFNEEIPKRKMCIVTNKKTAMSFAASKLLDMLLEPDTGL